MGSQSLELVKDLVRFEPFKKLLDQAHAVLMPYGFSVHDLFYKSDENTFKSILNVTITIAVVQVKSSIVVRCAKQLQSDITPPPYKVYLAHLDRPRSVPTERIIDREVIGNTKTNILGQNISRVRASRDRHVYISGKNVLSKRSKFFACHRRSSLKVKEPGCTNEEFRARLTRGFARPRKE